MATSIARLAIILGVNTAQLRQGLQQAQVQLTATKTHADRMRSTFDAVGQRLIAAAAGFVAFNKSINLASRGIRSFIAAGAEMQTEIARMTNGPNSVGALEHQMRRFERSQQFLGEGLASRAAKASDKLMDAGDAIREMLGNMRLSDAKRITDAWKAWSETAIKGLKNSRRAASDLRAEMQATVDSMTKAAAQVKEGIMTPVERFAKEAGDLLALKRFGLLDRQQTERAMASLRKDLFDSTRQAEKFHEAMSTPALEMNTQGALTAVNEARMREMSARDASLLEQRRQTQLLDEAVRLLKEDRIRGPERFKVGALK